MYFLSTAGLDFFLLAFNLVSYLVFFFFFFWNLKKNCGRALERYGFGETTKQAPVPNSLFCAVSFSF